MNNMAKNPEYSQISKNKNNLVCYKNNSFFE